MSTPGTSNTAVFSAQTANATSKSIETDGFDSAQQLEIRETAGGTCTIAIQGSFDGTNWYAVGYQQVDNTASLTRTVANLSVTANMAHVYQLLDPYPLVRVTISSIAGGGSVNVRAYLVP